MALIRNLNAAPIQEAVLDFVVDCGPLSEEKIRLVAEQLKRPGWSVHEMRAVEVTFDSTSSQKHMKVERFEGVRVNSAAEDMIVQVRPNRVTASHVKAYSNWEALQELALTALRTFNEVSGGKTVTRTGARFINMLRIHHDLPSTMENPPVTGLAGAAVTDFMQTHVIRFEDSSVSLNVSIGTSMFSFERDAQPEKGLLIDIDAYIEEPSKDCEGALCEKLSLLRKAKNDAFFGAVTDAALEIYE